MANITISTMTGADTPLAGTELMEMSQLSSTVKITATTISAAAADNSYNDSALGFGAAGFLVGDRVKVTGFTGNVVNNILTGVITALTNGKMTIGGTDGDVIVDDAAGESVTIQKWTTKRATVKDVGAGSNTSYVAFGSIASAAGVLTMDLSQNSNFTTTLTEDVTTVTMSNLQTGAGKANFFTMEIKQDATGGHAFTTPASWKFPSGSGYVPSTGANAVDLVQGISFDGGTTWLITFAKGYA